MPRWDWSVCCHKNICFALSGILQPSAERHHWWTAAQTPVSTERRCTSCHGCSKGRPGDAITLAAGRHPIEFKVISFVYQWRLSPSVGVKPPLAAFLRCSNMRRSTDAYSVRWQKFLCCRPRACGTLFRWHYDMQISALTVLVLNVDSKCTCSFFYRAMDFSAKRGIVIACRLSVRLSILL